MAIMVELHYLIPVTNACYKVTYSLVHQEICVGVRKTVLDDPLSRKFAIDKT